MGNHEPLPKVKIMRRSTWALVVLLLLTMEGFVLAAAPSGSTAGDVVRMSVSTDRYTYPLVGSVVVTVTVTNLQTVTLSGLSINSTVYDAADKAVLSLPLVSGVKVGPLTTAAFNATASYSLSDENYVIVSKAIVNGTEVGSANVPFVVLDTSGRAPLTLAMVFHMHQPIYLNLQGQFEQPWVQVHSGGDFEYNGSWYGAYFWHVLMLQDHPGIRVTFNLQPSLLYQWNASLVDFKYNGTFPVGGASLSHDLTAINETVDGYRTLAANGQIEILTSPFYHPLSAILVKLGWSSDLLAQIQLGKDYTDSYMDVNASGMWTPEMGFTMGMVPIIQQAGIRYTVLDEANHFVGAAGPGANSSVYQPFELDGANGSHIVVFFRDTEISNEFTSVWNSIPNPRVAASDFIAAMANVYRSSPGGVLTLASDGENPIALGDELISALDYNAIYGAIESQSWLQTSTLGSIVAQHPAAAKLDYVPDGSWSGGFGIWIGVQPKTAIWEAIAKARATLVNLTASYGANNPEIKKLWNYLYVAEGSDWEFQTPSGPAWFAMQGYRYANAATEYQAAPAQPPSLWPWYLATAGGVALIVAVGFVVARRRRP
jgi:alpha-amylase/alpha-mannosidase (GH57 family)